MDVGLILTGLIIGFSIAAPVGPIGVLCIRRTLAQGRSFGLVSGLGAATADAIYACIAGFGLTFISSILVGQQLWLRILGGLFLCCLGIRTFRSEPAESSVAATGKGLAAAYVSTFLLTLTNPMTVISFAAVFAGLGIATEGGDYVSAGGLVLGVFVGSGLWWFALAGGVGLFRGSFNVKGLRWVNRIAGAIIAGFGFFALLSLKL
ncbi:MAG: LysE family translocator [Deltaproteobacteria bacterium]|nr:LysE family translocator [Deltaproteobacteria bacterium]